MKAVDTVLKVNTYLFVNHIEQVVRVFLSFALFHLPLIFPAFRTRSSKFSVFTAGLLLYASSSNLVQGSVKGTQPNELGVEEKFGLSEHFGVRLAASLSQILFEAQ